MIQRDDLNAARNLNMMQKQASTVLN